MFDLTCLKCEQFVSLGPVSGHQYRFTSINTMTAFLSVRFIEPWNNHSPDIVDFNSLKSFKGSIKKLIFPCVKHL